MLQMDFLHEIIRRVLLRSCAALPRPLLEDPLSCTFQMSPCSNTADSSDRLVFQQLPKLWLTGDPPGEVWVMLVQWLILYMVYADTYMYYLFLWCPCWSRGRTQVADEFIRNTFCLSPPSPGWSSLFVRLPVSVSGVHRSASCAGDGPLTDMSSHCHLEGADSFSASRPLCHRPTPPLLRFPIRVKSISGQTRCHLVFLLFF